MISQEEVMRVLGGINDPELKKPFTELDMVRSVTIDDGVVAIGIALTVPGCPLKEKITDDIKTGVGALAGVSSVIVKFDVMSDQERRRLKEKLGMSGISGASASALARAGRCIAVASGKGGVGKSTVTANLAAAFARLGKKVGVLDADVYGFSIPRMLGMTGQPTVFEDKIVPLRRGETMQVVSMGFFIDEDQPIIWRGPLLHKAIKQFLHDVLWDDLDYLLLDLPPGTGDVTLTIAQSLPSVEMLVITTPQDAATHIAGRVARMATQSNLPVIGLIENMAYYERNGQREYIFGQEGGKRLAESLSVPLLGEIPLSSELREASDRGKPLADFGSDQQIAMFEEIALRIEKSSPR